jgi:hypothetical protein
LQEGASWESVPEDLLEDCAQLTKANSIDGESSFCFTWESDLQLMICYVGNKKDNVTVIYTPWSNLKKDGSMAVGQVGFKDQKKVSMSLISYYLVLCNNLPLFNFSLNSFVFAQSQCLSQVKRIHVAQRLNPVVNRLNKTKVEKFPDLRQEKEDRQRELRNRDRSVQLKRQKEEKALERERREKAWQKEHAYDDLFSEDAVAENSNQDRKSDFEDDFM